MKPATEPDALNGDDSPSRRSASLADGEQETGFAQQRHDMTSRGVASSARPSHRTPPGATATMMAPRLTPPLVSVIVLNYNYERFLREAVESVRAQTYATIECIIIDDCSTDGSAIVIEMLTREDANLVARKTERNGGQSAAALLGLESARGEFVLFLDADDVLLPAAVSRHVALHLLSRRGVGFTCCNAMQVNAGGRIVGRFTTLSNWFSQTAADPLLLSTTTIDAMEGGSGGMPIIDPGDARYIPWSTTSWPWTSMSCMVFRRDALFLIKDARGIPALRVGTDNLFAHFVNFLTGSIVLDECLVAYRLHGSNNFSRRASLDNFFCHRRADEHHDAVRRIILDDMIDRFAHYAENMDYPGRIIQICLLIDSTDAELGGPRWASRSRLSRLLVEKQEGWRNFLSSRDLWNVLPKRLYPYPWRRARQHR